MDVQIRGAGTALAGEALRAEARALIGDLQRSHAAVFGSGVALERSVDPRAHPSAYAAELLRRENAKRRALARLRATFAERLQPRLLEVRRAFASRGLASERFDRLVEGRWTLESFPLLWVDLHRMLGELAAESP